MDNEKWVWTDEEDSGPLALPPIERKLEPIIDWFAEKPEPAAPEGVAPAPDHSAKVAANGVKRPIPPSVVKAIVLHLEGRLEEAVEELRAGFRNGEPAADLFPALGALQMELGRFEEAASSYREALKFDPENENSKRYYAFCEEKAKEAKKPAPLPVSLLKAIALVQESKTEDAIKELQRGIKSEPAAKLYAALGNLQIEA